MKHRRKNYLINPKFQFRFISFMMLTAGLGMIIFYLCHLYFFWKLHQIGERFGLEASHPFFQMIKQQQQIMVPIFIASAFIFFLIILALGVFYSHRIAGPVFKIQRELLSLAQGNNDSGHVALRKTDFFPELANAVNQLRRARK